MLPDEDPQAKVRKVLLARLKHIASLARGLIAFEEQLALDGFGEAHQNLFLGINWSGRRTRNAGLRDTQATQRCWARRGDALSTAAQETHRLQVVYGQHGISLSTVPEFSLDDNTSMSDFLARQAAWQGQTLAEYGQNQEPIFSSGEMERLAIDSAPWVMCNRHPAGFCPGGSLGLRSAALAARLEWLAQQFGQGWAPQGDGQPPQGGGYPGSSHAPQGPSRRPGGVLPPNLPS